MSRSWLRSGFGTADLHAWAIEWKWEIPYGWMLFWPDGELRVYRTRAEAQAVIDRKMGYIRERPDLKAAPLHWRLPRPVKVVVSRRVQG